MLFTDPSFLLFLPILLALYFLAASVTHRIRRLGARQGAVASWVLLAGCLVFYLRGAGAFAWVISGAIAFNLWMARLVGRPRQGREAFFVVAVAGNVALFGLSKYAASAFGTFAPSTSERTLAVPQLLVPFGLAFFVLHAISYVADVYRCEGMVRPRLHQTVSYLLFFPVLVAGPIVRYRDFNSQLNRRQLGMSTFAYGVRRFAIGLGKTYLIGRTLAAQADVAFALPAGELSSAHAWLGATCFTLQIYFELSGYADMAIGLGRMLGYRLRENFRWPYVASTLHEFWQRWNISLLELAAHLRRPSPGGSPHRLGARPACSGADASRRTVARPGCETSWLGGYTTAPSWPRSVLGSRRSSRGCPPRSATRICCSWCCPVGCCSGPRRWVTPSFFFRRWPASARLCPNPARWSRAQSCGWRWRQA